MSDLDEKDIVLCSSNVASELLDSGLLFEINRRILHPIGKALVVWENSDGSRYLHQIRQDEDLEGTVFSREYFDEGFKKFQRLMLEQGGLDRLRIREKALGFIEQEEESP